MTELKLETYENRTQHQPGQLIEGLAGWQMDEPPESVEVCLFWYTAGKGDRDVGVVERKTFDNPAAVDAPIFSFEAPSGPYSYAGILISIKWAIELIVQPGNYTQRLDLTISPSGYAIEAGEHFDDEAAGALAKFKRMLQRR